MNFLTFYSTLLSVCAIASTMGFFLYLGINSVLRGFAYSLSCWLTSSNIAHTVQIYIHRLGSVHSFADTTINLGFTKLRFLLVSASILLSSPCVLYACI